MTQITETATKTSSIHYTQRGLFILFLWLLGGDFAFTFFESIFGRFIPIYLENLHASNTLIGILTGSVAGAVNIMFLPHISMASDRCRGRLGRRIPYILWSMPITVVSLILVGCAPEIGTWLHARLGVWLPVTATGLILALLSVFVVSYHFWNMVLVNAYIWLLRDVVPQPVIGRFMGWFRVVGAVSTFAFLWYVFPYTAEYRKTVFWSVGVWYAVVFVLMCWKVKEGEYPPAPEDTRPGFVRSFLGYFRDCLRVPLYRNIFIAWILWLLASGCSGPFLTLFARKSLNLSMEDIGRIFAWATLAGAIAYLPMGWVCDRFGAMWVALGGLVGALLVPALAYFLVHDRSGWLWYNLALAVPLVAWGLGMGVLNMELFPRERFGQLSAGMNVFGCGAFVFGNYLAGVFMDWTSSNYRMMFPWTVAFSLLSLVTMLMVYREWRKCGGPDHYVAPVIPD